MKFSVDQLGTIASSWLEEALLSKATPGQKLVLSFLWNQGSSKLLEQYKPYILMFSDNGSFDIEVTRANALAALKKVGGKYQIPLINYIIDDADINLFFEIAKKYAE